MTIAYTIGGMMVFPGNQIDRKWTINQARGCTRSISDRFDLTLECIRRHYSDRGSPLSSTLSRYRDFFALFDDFRGYVSFFLLDDLVNDDLSVKFFMPFDDFHPPSVPNDVGAYKEYRRRSIEFIEARNHRIKHLDFSDRGAGGGGRCSARGRVSAARPRQPAQAGAGATGSVCAVAAGRASRQPGVRGRSSQPAAPPSPDDLLRVALNASCRSTAAGSGSASPPSPSYRPRLAAIASLLAHRERHGGDRMNTLSFNDLPLRVTKPSGSSARSSHRRPVPRQQARAHGARVPL